MTNSNVYVTTGDERPPAGAVLLYEAEWNEEATADEHRAAVEYFARERGVSVERIPDLGPDDAVWIIPAPIRAADPAVRAAYNEAETLAEFGEWCAMRLFGGTPENVEGDLPACGCCRFHDTARRVHGA